MDEPKVPAAPRKALKYDPKSGLRFAGVPARDLTPEETHAWVRSKAQYKELLESGAYSVVDDTPAGTAQPAADKETTK